MNNLQSKLNSEQKRDAVTLALNSNTFARADQLRRFLQYICDMEISGRAEEISEYSIATEALGRPPGYSPGDDSSVRTRAHSLRQKLQEFYDLEAPTAPIRIELRKGHYVPNFIARQDNVEPIAPPPSIPVPPPAPAPAVSPPPSTSRLTVFIAGVAAGAVVIAAIFLLLPIGVRTPASSPALKEAWGTMLNRNSQVVICIASPPALLLKSFKEGTLPSVPRLMTPPKEVADWYASLHEQDGGGDLYMQTTMNTMLSGDSLAAVRAARLLASVDATAQVLPEWGLRPLALRGRNVLLIGSPNYSPYTARILRSAPFSVRYDTARREETIADGPPEDPKSHTFRPKRDNFGELTQVYGLLTVLPGEGHTKTVLFSGITSAGPQSAMEFFSSPGDMQDLRVRLNKEGRSGFPPAYQVVIRSGVDRALALNWIYETHRVIENPPSLE